DRSPRRSKSPTEKSRQEIIEDFKQSFPASLKAPAGKLAMECVLGAQSASLEENIAIENGHNEKLLAEAGYPNGIDIELGTSESFGGMVDLAVAFAGILAPVGIRVTVKQHPPSTYWDQVWLHGAMYVTYWTTR
ncbi:hypothetical protein EN852_035700, partial [Mesorhizobium sp. M2E.F.Ca.ET.209.01.1.1]